MNEDLTHHVLALLRDIKWAQPARYPELTEARYRAAEAALRARTAEALAS